MLTKPQLEKYADVLIWGLETARAKPYKPYDIILLRYDLAALPLTETLHRKLILRKWQVVLRSISTPVIEKDFYIYSDSRLRKTIGPWEEKFFSSINGNIFLSAPASLTHLKDVDPKRQNEVAVARKKLRKLMERREEKGLFGWTLCTYPTEAPAKRAKLSMQDYAKQIIKACFLNTKNPVTKWQEIHDEAMEIKKWLNNIPIKTIRLQSKSCDLTVKLGDKRRFLGLSGHNIPSFEIFTSPDWRGTQGRFYANLPSYRSGNYIEGIILEFKNGNVVKAKAKKGEKFLQQMVAMDPGAKRVGEFSLTDKRFSKIDTFMADTLFDENFGGSNGNSHIAIGASYSDTYSGNPATLTPKAKKNLGLNDSALHWDIINTEDKVVSAILKDGKRITLYEKGTFKY